MAEGAPAEVSAARRQGPEAAVGRGKRFVPASWSAGPPALHLSLLQSGCAARRLRPPPAHSPPPPPDGKVITPASAEATAVPLVPRDGQGVARSGVGVGGPGRRSPSGTTDETSLGPNVGIGCTGGAEGGPIRAGGRYAGRGVCSSSGRPVVSVSPFSGVSPQPSYRLPRQIRHFTPAGPSGRRWRERLWSPSVLSQVSSGPSKARLRHPPATVRLRTTTSRLTGDRR